MFDALTAELSPDKPALFEPVVVAPAVFDALTAELPPVEVALVEPVDIAPAVFDVPIAKLDPVEPPLFEPLLVAPEPEDTPPLTEVPALTEPQLCVTVTVIVIVTTSQACRTLSSGDGGKEIALTELSSTSA